MKLFTWPTITRRLSTGHEIHVAVADNIDTDMSTDEHIKELAHTLETVACELRVTADILCNIKTELTEDTP